MPRILEIYILISEKTEEKYIKKEYLPEYNFLYSFVNHCIEIGLFNIEKIDKDNLPFFWYTIFKEYLKYLLEKGGME